MSLPLTSLPPEYQFSSCFAISKLVLIQYVKNLVSQFEWEKGREEIYVNELNEE
jgi:hypothetical protein